eukprot:gene9980-11038_t
MSSTAHSSSSSKRSWKPRSRNDDPLIKWSKKLSWALRHHAVELGLSMRSDGYVLVSELLSHKEFKGLTWEVLQSIVEGNEKKRFALLPPQPQTQTNSDCPSSSSSTTTTAAAAAGDAAVSTDCSGWMIRAAQGHTMSFVEDESLLTPITSEDDLAARTSSRLVLHGTYRKFLPAIQAEGLKAMSRNHIHFAIDFPVSKKPAKQHLSAEEEQKQGEEKGVNEASSGAACASGSKAISGVRASAEVAIIIDLVSALAEGVVFLLSSNNVVLSRGLGDSGILPPRFFKEIIALDGKPL